MARFMVPRRVRKQVAAHDEPTVLRVADPRSGARLGEAQRFRGPLHDFGVGMASPAQRVGLRPKGAYGPKCHRSPERKSGTEARFVIDARCGSSV